MSWCAVCCQVSAVSVQQKEVKGSNGLKVEEYKKTSDLRLLLYDPLPLDSLIKE